MTSVALPYQRLCRPTPSRSASMPSRSFRRHRFPKRRFPLRPLLLFVGLPLLFLALLLTGRSLFFSGGNNEGVREPAGLPMELHETEAYPGGPLADGLVFDRLLVEKGKRRLTAFALGKAVRVYLVALGANPVGPKEMQGDKRTPEGRYTINDKNPNSAYYKNLGISYPNQADRARARALQKTPGGDIKIHGLAPDFADIGPAHRLMDWTHGCIAVTNEEMEELFTRTSVGTPIEIRP